MQRKKLSDAAYYFDPDDCNLKASSTSFIPGNTAPFNATVNSNLNDEKNRDVLEKRIKQLRKWNKEYNFAMYVRIAFETNIFNPISEASPDTNKRNQPIPQSTQIIFPTLFTPQPPKMKSQKNLMDCKIDESELKGQNLVFGRKK